MLSSLEKFDLELKSFSPHLVIVSGLQMLDNFPFTPGMLLLCCYPSRMDSVLLTGHQEDYMAVAKDILVDFGDTG